MRIGLALGGGGVWGVAHALVLELFDELGVRPRTIAGTSIGALVGALYASGLSGRGIRELIERRTIAEDDTWRDILAKREGLLDWLRGLAPEGDRGGVISAEGFIGRLFERLELTTFEQLQLPLKVVATDYSAGTEVVFTSGELQPAVQASMAVPGLFKPVRVGERLLIDGGVVSQLPYDTLGKDHDLTVAVDLSSGRARDGDDNPSALQSALRALDLLQGALLDEKLKRGAPDIHFKPEIVGVPFMDFGKAGEVARQVRPQLEALQTTLTGELR